MAGYKQAYAEGKHDGLGEGVYHHDKIDNHDRNIRHDIPWFEGYTTGWNQGCVDSGRTQDDCDSQADANTP